VERRERKEAVEREIREKERLVADMLLLLEKIESVEGFFL